MTHHPDCSYWLDNYARECSCGLTAPAIGNLHPWTKKAWDEWAAAIRCRQEKTNAQ